jgi:hypothetical protein
MQKLFVHTGCCVKIWGPCILEANKRMCDSMSNDADMLRKMNTKD